MSPAGRGDPCLEPPIRLVLPGPLRVRVVEVVATGTTGGAQEHVHNLLSRIDRSRYDVSVVSLSHGRAIPRIERLGIPTLVIDEPDDDAAAEALARYLVEIGPDVVHNHMHRAEVVGTRAVGVMAAAGHARPYVISTVHSSRVRSVEDRAQVAALTSEMDRLIAVSKTIEAKIVEERSPAIPVSLVYNGIDLERYDHQEPCCTLREEYGMEPSARIVGVVARLEPEKGHQTLLEAWPQVLRRCPDAYLLLVGEGGQRAPLEDLARRLRIAHRVVFAGNRDDVPAVTAAIDVAVLPSYREAQGLVVLEAMALSRPVVATAVGGIVEMIDDGVTGLLVPPHEPGPLAAAVVRLLVDTPFADTLARRAHDMVHDRFCVELMVKAIEELYDEGANAARVPDLAAV
jgi:glycosyltransferase involved in cell wall biosynthesis